MQTVNVVAPPVMRRPDTPEWLTDLARFCAGLTFDQLPDVAVERTKQVILDSVGAIAAGAQEPEVVALSRRLTRLYGAGDRPLVGLHARGPAALAALLGGTAGTMLELDEGNQYARGHPGIHVIPAALALAPADGRTGRDLITAVALGYEVGARIGIASKLRTTMHPHGTWGTVGAAVTAAKLAGADAAQFVETMNVASSLGLTTSRRTMLEGGTVRNSFAGFSNEIGLVAWEMVAAGFTGEADGLGTVYGSVIAEDWRPEQMLHELGTRWEIARNYFKRHACCRYNHGALDALLRMLATTGPLKPQDIARVDIATYVWAAQLAGQEPHNMLAAKFSLPFSIATTIAHGAATVEGFREEARADPAIRDLARRVFVTEDPALTAKLPGLRPARVRLTLSDGRVLEDQSLTNRGDTEDPYTAEDVRAKFHELAGPVWGAAHATAIQSAVEALDRTDDLTTFDGLLAA